MHRQIQTIFTRFLWKGNITRKGEAKVSCTTVCLPKIEGGLGIKNPIEWNKAKILLHLWRVVSKSQSFWPLWVNTTVLKHMHFWTFSIPTDCSWIWRKIFSCRNEALHFNQYHIGDGCSTSFWFDPWWHNKALASSKESLTIRQSGLSHNFLVHSIIASGLWALPKPNPGHHHLDDSLTYWLSKFDFSRFDLLDQDMITWNCIFDRKVKLDIYGTTSSIVPLWCLGLTQYVPLTKCFALLTWSGFYVMADFTLWRLYTMDKLLAFGVRTQPHCFLYAGGLESHNYPFCAALTVPLC